MKVKWDFQSTKTTRITQCHNCQMYGHGSSRCKVKTFCANCAGNHNTSECNENIIKCANCNGPHKSTDNECPSKAHYLNVKQRNQRTNRHKSSNNSNIINNNTNFPNALRQNVNHQSGVWNYQRNNNNYVNSHNNNNGFQNLNNFNSNTGDLFTIQELQTISIELITKLRSCTSKLDQFEVITNLAFKFLS